ncbi:glutamate 5-kinase [Methanolobus bombayensis]|uniref:glutamate 5-kinase n=1 Tax=Methanolobus bombayensis TaxID=38023 RepID=UPI001AE11CD7|nr:glutamate 5-kinase [Methanolobus bombayensis]MBP1909233.1 glutamate 5-kinase [Methanolobus bombayensis]
MSLYQNRIVVKVGTSTLTNDIGKSDLRSFDRIACVLADIQNMGYEVILVSSGAIAVGTNKLQMKTRPTSMRLKQAAAAVGQCSIMHLYDKFFNDYDKAIAQILLNAEDMEIEEKKDNLINTFDALLEMGIIPIVNENDSVSYTEIESEDRLFGDNDMLSAVVAVLCRAQKLVILSDIDGFYDNDPRLYPNAKRIEYINAIDEEMLSLAGGAGSRRGTGGMKTKLQAAKLATTQGIDTIITNGKNPSALYEIINGDSVGTLFSGKYHHTESKVNPSKIVKISTS